MNGWNMPGWGWNWMGLGFILGLVVIALVAWTLTRDLGSRAPHVEEDPALEVLRRRFASGEIDEDEFRRQRAALERRV